MFNAGESVPVLNIRDPKERLQELCVSAPIRG